ncbi:MAG: tRNA (N(6)-L-threonylcarbamoyladenosine(37)-C(2))-methylthiotransferase MtaB [Pseudomonadota bacterium]
MAEIEISLEKVGKGSSVPSQPVLVDAIERPLAGKRVGLTTLGCKVNTFESEMISQALQTQDWSVVPHSEVADLYIINTCTVTKEADRQARQAVRRAVKRNSDAIVLVTGCYAQMDPDACAAIPGVDLVLGNDRKLDVHNLLPRLERGELPKVMVGDLHEQVSLPTELLTRYEAQTRAFVQIQQGCDQGCTFCIIHVARGPSRSLPATLIKRQVARLALTGYSEVVLCGVDLGSYGDDHGFGALSLVELVKELLDLPANDGNEFRLRLSSIDPAHITDDLIALYAKNPRLCPHIHLSMQSGNTLVLKRMKRRYSASFIRERIMTFREHVPDLVISADVLVGFPTETEAQFQDTLDVIEELNIAFPHVFSYSERDGTPAARIPEAKQVPVPVRKQRNQQVRDLGQNLRQNLLHSRVGQEGWVLPEKESHEKNEFIARGEDYLSVKIPANGIEHGRWTKVRFLAVEGDYLLARPVSI